MKALGLSGALAFAIASVLIAPACSRRKPGTPPPPPPSADEPVAATREKPTPADDQGRGRVEELLNAWKVGDHPKAPWKDGKERGSLYTVREFVFLKSATSDEARAAWLKFLRAEGSEQLEHLDEIESPSERMRVLSELSTRLVELANAQEGDKAMLAKHAPGTYASHRYRVASSTKGGVPIEKMWDFVTERLGSEWKVVAMVEAQ